MELLLRFAILVVMMGFVALSATEIIYHVKKIMNGNFKGILVKGDSRICFIFWTITLALGLLGIGLFIVI